MIEPVYIVVGGIVAGITSGGIITTLIIYMLKNKVGKDEAVQCRAKLDTKIEGNRVLNQTEHNHLTEVSNLNHAESMRELKRIRLGVAATTIFTGASGASKAQRLRELVDKDPVLSKKDLANESLIRDAIVERMNGD